MGEGIFLTGFIAAIKLRLRRTLLRFVLYSAFAKCKIKMQVNCLADKEVNKKSVNNKENEGYQYAELLLKSNSSKTKANNKKVIN